MTLLLRDPDAKAPAPNAETPPDDAPEVRACPSCQSPLEPDQDWCLQCGQARPGRVGGMPGRRATATVLTVTALIAGGAVAASYAALNHHGKAPASPTPTQLAQVPSAAVPAAPAPPPPAPAA